MSDTENDTLLREARLERDKLQEDLKVVQDAWGQAKTNRAEALRDRDEAQQKLKLALEQWEIALEQLQLHNKKVERQAERIRELEGATNHAAGTPLTIALRERDEWAALCGRYKQERDEAKEKLREWQTLRAWGAEPEQIDAFIKGQQHRIHCAQDVEVKLADALRERDEARAELDILRLNSLGTIHPNIPVTTYYLLENETK